MNIDGKRRVAEALFGTLLILLGSGMVVILPFRAGIGGILFSIIALVAGSCFGWGLTTLRRGDPQLVPVALKVYKAGVLLIAISMIGAISLPPGGNVVAAFLISIGVLFVISASRKVVAPIDVTHS